MARGCRCSLERSAWIWLESRRARRVDESQKTLYNQPFTPVMMVLRSPSSSRCGTKRPTSTELYRGADRRSAAVRAPLRDPRHRRRQHRRHVRAAGGAAGARTRGCGSSGSAATSARPRRLPPGFAHARGRFIVTSDGDLQNDPRDIPGNDRDRSSSAAPTSSPAGARIGRTRFSTAGCRR